MAVGSAAVKRNHLSVLAAIALAAPLVTACGATAAASRADTVAPGCPASGPELAPPRAGPPAPSPLIRPGAATAVICQYALRLPAGKASGTPLRRLVLRGAAAAGLAAVLDAAGPLTPHATQCDRQAGRLPFDQLIRFGYRDGRAGEAVVTFTGCQLAVVTAGGRSGTVTGQGQGDLFGYTSITGHDRGPLVPDMIGLGAAAAASLAQRHGFSLSVDDEAVDPAVPFGMVIFQSLPPAVRDSVLPAYSLGVIVAVTRAPACRAGQLRLDYRAGGEGAGNDFGLIMFRDVAPAPCRLAGRLGITGLNAAGQAVTSTATAFFAAPGVLSPDTARVWDGAGAPPASMVYSWLLVAEYRDDPAAPGGLCPHQVIPVAWRVRLPGGFVVTVPNADTGSPFGGLAGLVTCRGRLGALSEAMFFG
jgi:hypothetical protein